ncbi:MAG TPA: Crp/Fnr family transcriptional regulator [Pyrinomonadaceae bacterium]|nr:Crp/Fnr family transcriptional regulator [Pyrinomonadaceae bacterium]
MENRLLTAFPRDELEELRPHFERVSLPHGQHAIMPDEPIRDVYFPLNCLLSLVTTMVDGASVESGSIGREGMSGIPVLLDAERTPMPTFVQVPGEAVRLRAEQLKQLYEESPAVRRLLNRYIHVVIVNGSHAAACNRLHRLDERFCKWLLMSCDGVGSEEIDLTHDYLAIMIGVRRAGVTEAAGKAQEMGLISYKRGHIRITDRKGLEACACECYRRTKDEYERLFARE